MFNLEPGIIVVALAMVVFYFRFIQLRGKKKREISQENTKKLTPQQLAKAKKAQKYGAKIPQKEKKTEITYQVKSWWLLALGIMLTLVGVGIRTSTLLPKPYADFWWVPVSLGLLILTFILK